MYEVEFVVVSAYNGRKRVETWYFDTITSVLAMDTLYRSRNCLGKVSYRLVG